MNKLLAALAGIFLCAACSSQTDGFAGKEYKLVNAPADATITIGFDGAENRYFGQSAVNRYFGSYTQDGEKIEFGPAGVTMMAGPEPLMQAETQYLQDLAAVKTYKLDGKKLVLTNSDGKELVFEETGPVAQQ